MFKEIMTTIFAPITAIHNSSVVVIRISGNKTQEILKILGVKKVLQHQKITFEKIVDPKTTKTIDECLISFFKAPHSFTGEDVAEINLHGSPFIVKKLIKILSEIPDVRMAEAGEFSKIAVLNNKMDLLQAESIVDLIKSETEIQHKQALKQLQGNLGNLYENWRVELINSMSLLEAYIDFPDEDLPQNIISDLENKVLELGKEIKNHLNDGKIGQKIKDGLNIAIIGAPNAGKSSLINYLNKRDVAIVSEIAGTTRDVIETHLDIAGMAVNIADTAGIRTTDSVIEKEGIRRALMRADEADVKIFIVDIRDFISGLSLENIELIDEKTILLINKIDLVNDGSWIEILRKLPIKTSTKIAAISLREKINLEEFHQILEEKIKDFVPKNDSPLITKERYRIALNEALENLENFNLEKNVELAAEDLRMAAFKIGKIIGKIAVDDILDKVFADFCIGK